MKTRLDLPELKEWCEIFYYPLPIFTTLETQNSIKYWEEEIPGCKIIPVDKPENKGFGWNLMRGIRVKIVYPPEITYSYVRPLSDMHIAYWDCASWSLGEMYETLNSKNRLNKTNLKIRSLIHSLLALVYWDILSDSYKQYTPDEWANTLNGLLEIIESNQVKKKTWDNDLTKLEELMIASLKYKSTDKVDWSMSLTERKL